MICLSLLTCMVLEHFSNMKSRGKKGIRHLWLSDSVAENPVSKWEVNSKEPVKSQQERGFVYNEVVHEGHLVYKL